MDREYQLRKYVEREYAPLIKAKDFAKVKQLLESENLNNKEKEYVESSIIGRLLFEYEDTLEGLDELSDIATRRFGFFISRQWYRGAIFLLSKKSVDVNGIIKFGNEKTPYIANHDLYRVDDDVQDYNTVRLKVIEMMLQQGANPNSHDSPDEVTPLMLAMNYENVPALRLLLKHGASLEYKTHKHDHIRFMCARLWQMGQREQTKRRRAMKSEIIRLLEQALKTTTPQDLNYVSAAFTIPPLHYIASTNLFRVAKMLLDAGADPYVRVYKYSEIYTNNTAIEIANKPKHTTYKNPGMGKFLEEYVKEKEAKTAFKILNALQSPENKSVPYDIALTIAKKTANMSDDQFLNFAKATYSTLRRQAKTTKKKSTPSQ